MTASSTGLPGQRPAAQSSPHAHGAGTLLARAYPATAVIPLPAEIDICIRGQLEASVSLALGDGAGVLIADASRTTFCDCSGVHALVRAHRQAAAAGVQLRIAASPAMRRMLQLTGSDGVLDSYRTLSEARAGR